MKVKVKIHVDLDAMRLPRGQSLFGLIEMGGFASIAGLGRTAHRFAHSYPSHPYARERQKHAHK